MLIKCEKGVITSHCDDCGNIEEFNTSKYTPIYDESMGEYNNLMVDCSECGGLEIFNMNLDIDEDLTDSGLPEREIIQRGLVKELINDLVVNIVE